VEDNGSGFRALTAILFPSPLPSHRLLWAQCFVSSDFHRVAPSLAK